MEFCLNHVYKQDVSMEIFVSFRSVFSIHVSRKQKKIKFMAFKYFFMQSYRRRRHAQ